MRLKLSYKLEFTDTELALLTEHTGIPIAKSMDVGLNELEFLIKCLQMSDNEAIAKIRTDLETRRAWHATSLANTQARIESQDLIAQLRSQLTNA